MAKTYLPAGGGLTFKSVLRFVGPSPLDGRGVVDSLSDISGQAYKTTFGGSEFEDVASYYEGMLVVTKDTGKLYVLNSGTFKEVTPDLSGIQGTLDAIPNTYVPKTLTINGKALNGNITLNAEEVGALPASGTALKALALSLTQAIGNTKTPVYFNAEGKPVALGYTIEKSVPADAVFTDTTYSNENGITLNSGKFGLNLNSTISLGTIGQNKVYAVGLDAAGKVAVKVDWTDEKVNISNLGPTATASTKHYVTTAQEAGNSSLDIANDSLQGVYIERSQTGTTFVAPTFKGTLKGNADTATKATTATNLENAPSIQSDTLDNTKVTITAGGKTSDAFTVPYAATSEQVKTADLNINIGLSNTKEGMLMDGTMPSIQVPVTRQEYQNIYLTPSLSLPNNGYLGFLPFIIVSGWRYNVNVLCVKSNGYAIPGEIIYEDNGDSYWVSSNEFLAGELENIEMTIKLEAIN